MEIMDSFYEWVEEQKENKNFPDFGETCSEYDIIPLQNMANLATVSEDGLAKYMLGVRIDYKEEGIDAIWIFFMISGGIILLVIVIYFIVKAVKNKGLRIDDIKEDKLMANSLNDLNEL